MDFMFLESTLCFILHMLYQFDQIFFENKVKFSCNMCLCFLYTHMYIFGGGGGGLWIQIEHELNFCCCFKYFCLEVQGKKLFSVVISDLLCLPTCHTRHV